MIYNVLIVGRSVTALTAALRLGVRFKDLRVAIVGPSFTPLKLVTVVPSAQLDELGMERAMLQHEYGFHLVDKPLDTALITRTNSINSRLLPGTTARGDFVTSTESLYAVMRDHLPSTLHQLDAGVTSFIVDPNQRLVGVRTDGGDKIEAEKIIVADGCGAMTALLCSTLQFPQPKKKVVSTRIEELWKIPMERYVPGLKIYIGFPLFNRLIGGGCYVFHPQPGRVIFGAAVDGDMDIVQIDQILTIYKEHAAVGAHLKCGSLVTQHPLAYYHREAGLFIRPERFNGGRFAGQSNKLRPPPAHRNIDEGVDAADRVPGKWVIPRWRRQRRRLDIRIPDTVTFKRGSVVMSMWMGLILVALYCMALFYVTVVAELLRLLRADSPNEPTI